ncbi:DUF4337 domain-containing protein [Sphingomonas bacterium]|uniref:DUF4337 domain-containing protein n=1 Tax=Sphingomonas bacterium TaxID=1895847 RepID=UPI0015765019|nr:DUF4337 domain-containing protein [Sphingomonas bacterium]
MSEEYEVRGPHEEAVEHRAEHREPLAQQIALFSAVLATIGAVVSLLGGHTQNDALYYKNEAVLLKARASDNWSYYQAEEIKRHLLEATAPLSHDAGAAAKIASYAARSRILQADAQALDHRSEEADAESQHALHPHVKLSVAMTFVQIAIALASITALTRRRWLFALAGASAAIGCVLALVAWS